MLYKERLILTFFFFYETFIGLTVCRCLHVLCLCLVAVCQLFLHEYMDIWIWICCVCYCRMSLQLTINDGGDNCSSTGVAIMGMYISLHSSDCRAILPSVLPYVRGTQCIGTFALPFSRLPASSEYFHSVCIIQTGWYVAKCCTVLAFDARVRRCSCCCRDVWRRDQASRSGVSSQPCSADKWSLQRDQTQRAPDTLPRCLKPTDPPTSLNRDVQKNCQLFISKNKIHLRYLCFFCVTFLCCLIKIKWKVSATMRLWFACSEHVDMYEHNEHMIMYKLLLIKLIICKYF